ncbi:zinc finger protein 16 [Trichonephila inaurata madagascariensis]|uniref:Zinc finger protein 16 n=1 Tax=Trichonephila inaurata madagascariensis TaxID=2747483 RepID=A0A8X7CDK1_9ARAC|nr:zinc finger protein 16 [Trichonephila inaurata madagascariensis]
MDDKTFSNEYETPTENELERTFVTLPPFSSIRTKAFENDRNEYRPIVNEEILNYSPQSPAINYSLPMEDCWSEPSPSNASGLVYCLQAQNNFQEDQPNSIFKCNKPNGHNDLQSENLDYRWKDLIWTELTLFDPKAEVSVFQRDHLDANVRKNSESKSESIELKNQDFKFDSGFSFYDSSIKSDPLTENYNFHSRTEKPSFEKNYCEKCFKTFNRKHALLKHKCVKSNDKDFQNVDCQQQVYQVEQKLEYARKNTKENSVQCGVCEQKLSSKQTLARHMRLHTGTSPYRCSVCGKGFTQSSVLNEHMRIHTGEKPFRCNVCQKCFANLSNLTVHLRTHTKEKPFQCPLCKKHNGIITDRILSKCDLHL